MDARERMVAGAADMIGRRGASATSLRELAKHSGAPLGSTYHYFPGGKAQLAAEAVHWADDITSRKLGEVLATGPVDGLAGFLALWRQALIDSDFRAGCPVLAVSVEEPADGETAPLDAAVFAFSRWTTILAQALRDEGVRQERATGIATLIVAGVEGAVAMCRAERGTQPLDTVGAQLHDVLSAVLR